MAQIGRSADAERRTATPPGLLVESVAGIPALARFLDVAAEAVADSLGRCLVALRTSDLTAATVRALRGGLRIPPRATGPT